MTISSFGAATSRDIHPVPGNAINGVERNKTYNLLLNYYNNKSFDTLSEWANYKQRYGLYRYIRPLYNPVSRIVDFYVESIYPGYLSPDVDDLKGVQLAVPLHPSTSNEIRRALKSIWKWSNWAVNKDVMVFYASLTGNCLVEVVDDPALGKVRLAPVWPGYVSEFELNDFGELVAYELKYNVRSADGTNWEYRKVVTPTSIVEYNNDRITRNTENPYPFVPAVWVKHLDVGNDFGTPAVRSIVTMDEINSIVSHTADHIHKQIRSPRIMWSNGVITSLFGDSVATSDQFDERSQVPMLKGGMGGNTETLVGNLDPQTIMPLITQLLEQIEAEYPEITVYAKLRDQNITTGPAAAALVGDVVKKIARPSQSYDAASARLFQMAIAVAGWRLNQGDWGADPTDVQDAFSPFDLESYTREELDIRILPRDLLRRTTFDDAEELQYRAIAVNQASDALPRSEKLRIMGIREADIPARLAEMDDERSSGLLPSPLDVKTEPEKIKADAVVAAATISAKAAKETAKTNAKAKPVATQPKSKAKPTQ